MICAVKIVQKSRIEKHKVLVELMNNELEVLAKTDHPHIVRTKEIIEDENNYYIVSELVTGGELYQKILEKRKFSEQDSAEYVKQIALALNYMHV